MKIDKELLNEILSKTKYNDYDWNHKLSFHFSSIPNIKEHLQIGTHLILGEYLQSNDANSVKIIGKQGSFFDNKKCQYYIVLKITNDERIKILQTINNQKRHN